MRKTSIKYLVRTTIILSALLFSQGISLAQRGTPFVFTKELPIENASKEKAYKKSKNWLEDIENVSITRWNDDQCVVEATGFLNYSNDVVLEDILLSPNAALRTKGVIKFVIKINAFPGKCKIEFIDFTHEAFYSRYGQISLGLILNNDKAPLDKCFENTAWCNAVWNDMKVKIRQYCIARLDEAKKKFN